MHRMLTVKNTELNSFLKCPLCKGYLIDAYSINECLHSFCKSCIIKYIKKKECCPSCKVSINKDHMKFFLRRDVNLQYIVYKLVPSLFKNEMQRRRIFYAKHPKAIKYLKKRRICDKETLGKLDEDEFIFEMHSDVSLSIEYSEQGLSEICESMRTKEMDPPNPRTFLSCPATMTIELLQKFLSIKHPNTAASKLEIMYDDTPLKKDLTLLDVGYIYAWRRITPMRLFYRIAGPESVTKCQEGQVESTLTNHPQNNSIAIDNEVEVTKEGGDDDEEILPEAVQSDEFSKNIDTIEINERKSIEISVECAEGAEVYDIKKELIQSQESDNEISIDANCTNNNNNQTLNQTLNENLTITAMMASIGSQNKLPVKLSEDQTNVSIVSDKNNRIEAEANSDKENNDITKEKQSTQPIAPSGDSVKVAEQLNVNGIINSKVENALKEGVLLEKDKPVETSHYPESGALLQNKDKPVIDMTHNTNVQPLSTEGVKLAPVTNGNKLKTKAKKNPAAPGSAGGVAKKKKDALTTNNEGNTGNEKAIIQPKKPRAMKPKAPNPKAHATAKSNQSSDLKNVQIKQQPVEPQIPQQLQFPQIKLENSYNPAQQQQHTFQQQIQQQFNLTNNQSLFSPHNMPNASSNVQPANNTQLMSNSFQLTSMSLMNQLLNSQQQQKTQDNFQTKEPWSWNHINKPNTVANALQMSQKFNPQLFEYFKAQQQHQQQQQQQQHNQQTQSHNFFNQHLPQQFQKSQCEDYKPVFPNNNGVAFQDPALTQNNHYFNQIGNQNKFQNNNLPGNYQPFNSSSSTCSSEGNQSVENTNNAKEAGGGGLSSIISQSCNLVNEFD